MTAASAPCAAMESAAEFCTVLGLPLSVLTIAKEDQLAERILHQAKSYLKLVCD